MLSRFQVVVKFILITCQINFTHIYTINPLDLTGPHVDQNMFCQEMFTYPNGLHVDHLVNGSVYIREPSSYYFNCFYLLHCKCCTNSAKNTLKTDPKFEILWPNSKISRKLLI